MSNQNESNGAKAPAVAPKTTEDYHSAALAAIRAAPTDEAPSTPPPSAPLDLNKGPKLDESKLVVQSEEAEPAPKQEAKKEPEKAPASDSIKRSFERMAQEKAALRQEKEQVKIWQEAAKTMRPAQLETIAKAISEKDPISLLAAAGFSEQELAQIATEGKRSLRELPKPKSELEALREELAAVKSRLQTEDINSGRKRTLAKLDELAKSDSKFEYVSEVEGATQRALDVLEDYVSKNGPPLDENGRVDQGQLQDLYVVSLQYVEEQLKTDAERWEKVLTKRKGATSVPSEPTDLVQAVSEQARSSRTLNNALTSPAPSRTGGPKPKTDEDYIALAAQSLRSRAQ